MRAGNNQTPTVMAVAVMARVMFLTHWLSKKTKSKDQIYVSPLYIMKFKI